MVRSKKIESLKQTLQLTERQREILVGILLGDGHLEPKPNQQTFRLKIEQSTKHHVYVDHLYEVFQDWVLTAPRVKTRSPVDNKSTQSVSFQTVSHSAFRFYFQQFYSAGKKVVPKLIHRWLTPTAIAYWFMDDGSIKSKQSKGVLFNTQGFSKPDIERLIKILQTNFSLACSMRKQSDGVQIYVSGNSYETFVELVEGDILKEMRYKIPPPRIHSSNRMTAIRQGRDDPKA